MRTLVLGLLLVLPMPVGAQPVPPRVQTIIETLAARRPDLALGGDDQRRELTRSIIEQLVYESPADGWGWKSADPSRPPSKDGIARRVGASLIGCDWQNGETRQAHRPVVCHDISDQHFIPLAGRDHLGSSPSAPPIPVPVPVPFPTPVHDDEVLALLRQASDQQERIYRDLVARTEQIVNEARAQHSAVREQIRAHDENPSWLQKVVSNRYFQLISAAAAGWITERLASK